MQTFSVKNFEQFQHYRDRAPPWIKLYNSILDDYQFAALSDASKAHLMMIWLLASRTENRIPWDENWVASRISASDPVDLRCLFDAGFIYSTTPDDKSSAGKRVNWPTRYINKEIRAAVFARDNSKCRECNATEHLEIDHILPISQGGKGVLENLQILCVSCNRRKRATQLRSNVLRSEPDLRSLEREREQRQSRAETEQTSFAEFWRVYPHKVGKGDALKAFKGALSKTSLDSLVSGVLRYRADKPPDHNWCNPATWLNQERWQDEPAAPIMKGNGHGPASGIAAGFAAALARNERPLDCGEDFDPIEPLLVSRRK